MVIYFNFILDDFATEYTRKHYTLIDLFEEMGGLIKQFALIAILLMKPFTFMRHDLLVFKNHAKKHKYDTKFIKEQNNKFFSIEFYALIHYLSQTLCFCKNKGKQKIINNEEEL